MKKILPLSAAVTISSDVLALEKLGLVPVPSTSPAELSAARRGRLCPQQPQSLWLKLVSLLLAPLLLSACLTTKGTSKAPSFRGLTASEADRLETMNNPGFRDPPLLRDKDETPESLAETAELFLQTGDYERSLYNYSKILALHPERHDIRYKLGLALLLSGKLADAKKELAEVILHRADMLEAHEALGMVFLQENRVGEAQQEFRAVLALDPNRFQARCLLGEAFLQDKQYTQALAEFQTARGLSPDSPRLMSNLGWVYFKTGKPDQALQWLQKAQAQSPDHPRINHRLGMVLAAQKKYPEALAAFRKGGDEAQALNNIGVHYYLDGRYAEAARCFQKALEMRPTFYQEAKVNLEKALARLQEDKTADKPDKTPVPPERLSMKTTEHPPAPQSRH